MADVLVQCETPMLGLEWRQQVRLTVTPLVAAAIAQGRLTVLAEYPAEPEPTAEPTEPAGGPVVSGWFAAAPESGSEPLAAAQSGDAG